MQGVDSARESLPCARGGGTACRDGGAVGNKRTRYQTQLVTSYLSLKIAVTTKIDVTEKLSRNLTSATD